MFDSFCSYDNLADTTTALMRAHQKLLLVHHSRPVFYNNVNAAFDILSKQKGMLEDVMHFHYNLLCVRKTRC